MCILFSLFRDERGPAGTELTASTKVERKEKKLFGGKWEVSVQPSLETGQVLFLCLSEIHPKDVGDTGLPNYKS